MTMMIRFGPMALGLLILVVSGSTRAGTDTELEPEPFSPLAFETYQESRVHWTSKEGVQGAITTYLGPEALYDAWGRSGGVLLKEQLKRGDGVFIRGEMPLEFVIMIRTVGLPLTLYAGGDAKPFTEALLPVMWYGGDGPFENEGRLAVISSVELPQRFGSTWEELLKEKKPVVLESKEGARVRLRLTLTDEQIQRARSKDGKEGVFRFGFAVKMDTSKVNGNEELVGFLLTERHGMKTTILWFPSVFFQLIDKEAAEDYRWIDYQCWRIRSWRTRSLYLGHDYQEQRLDAYEQFLKLVPDHEYVWLEYGNYLEKIGEYDKAIAVARKLLELVQRESRKYPIVDVAEEQLGPAVPDSGPHPPVGYLVQTLNHHVERLEKLKATKANEDTTDKAE